MVDTHFHKCSVCSSIWEHEDLKRNEAEAIQAHTCKCGNHVHWKYQPTVDELKLFSRRTV